MGIANDGLMQVRAQLFDRIDQIACDLCKLSTQELANRVDAIRRKARDHGLYPVEQLAHSLETALWDNDGAVMVSPYLQSMRDAVGCERVDSAAATSYLAVVGQRLYG